MLRLAPTVPLAEPGVSNARVGWDEGLSGLRLIVRHDQLACSTALSEKVVDRQGQESETTVGEEQADDGGGTVWSPRGIVSKLRRIDFAI